VAVVAAGAMNYVPFQVLRTADGVQVVDRFTVSNLPSASTVPLLHATRVSDRSLFVGALGRSTVPGWPPLPGTLREAREIARIYPRARLVVEDQFTASRVIAALQRDSVVHLATHGDVDDQAPLFSAVITTPSRGEASRLSLYELMNVRVKSDLVVLSACQTAAGKLLGGDEITSLTRTLLLAGSNAVVSSLWNIDDAVTADLMRVFYAELRRGRPPADALRTAELAIRKQHPEPAYWAPFVATSVR
jgi:CHAT domain-containing protein